ncbi:hypothetical protein FPQ18DRAFT_356853 [Pyronema domesticum]|uniref:Similar to Probable protein Pop3 acc. no. Q9LUV2 n=1 Tax=Pyronema omphalodes (strain CBS 100304) TaxID=1076935 RepID=U4LDV9_PYROM|nr:hypothetical protein FPQ18DRAFT_356853 [Pyronema domesticum]CCX30053.1 Similar to Probable protein Pop3; acc. no. Q9LUV2 [Pyronema omphalodes CBS 100304]
MPILHLVLFRFKLDNNNPAITSDEQNQQITSACNSFLELKEKCVNPETMEPYLLDVRGGKDCSPEGIQGGITHAFVVEFAGESDRDYYLKHDPAHLAFVEMVGNIVEKVQVIDFVPGKF